MKIGFTGTRTGMTNNQTALFKYHLLNQGLEVFNHNEFHHGVCVGADAEAHQIIQELSESIPFHIIGHPSNKEKWRADVLTGFAAKWKEKDPLVRNQDIVDTVDLMIACPLEMHNTTRSGSWNTIRKAQASHVPVIIIPGAF